MRRGPGRAWWLPPLLLSCVGRPAEAQRLRGTLGPAELYDIGHSLCLDDQYGIALWPLSQAVRLAPKEAEYHLWLGNALCHVGLFRDAMPELQAAASATEQPIARNSALNYLGVLAAIDGRKDEARDLFKEASPFTSDSGTAAKANAQLLDAGRPLTWYGLNLVVTSQTETASAVTLRLVDAAGALDGARTEVKSGYFNDALRLAQFVAAQPDTAALGWALVAEICRLKGWCVEAFEAYNQSLRLQADPALQQRRNSLAAEHLELAMQPTDLLVGNNFRVRYACSRRAAERVLAYLERTMADATQTFGVRLPTVYVTILSDQQALVRYETLLIRRPAPEWEGAFALPSPHSPGLVCAAAGRDVLTTYLTHELGHLVFHAIAGQYRMPAWLDEGLAEVVAKGRQPSSDRLRAASHRNGLRTPAQLDAFWHSAAIMAATDATTTRLYYDEAHAVSSYLLQAIGPAGVLEWLLRIRLKQPAEQSFQQLTGVSCDQLFQAWAAQCLR